MLKIHALLFLMCIVGACTSHASLQLYPRTHSNGSLPPTRALTIILDDSEKSLLGAATYSTLVALYQQASPVLVSMSVVKNLFTPDSSQELTLEDIQSKRVAESEKVVPTLLKKFFMSSFEPEAWSIYQVNPFLCLFVPHAYIKTLGELPPESKKWSSLELLLGLKVDHLQKITLDELKKQIASLKKGIPSSYFIKALYNQENMEIYADEASSIFIPSRAYENKLLIPQWAIYLLGHGGPETISGLFVSWFRYFLAFLNTKIMTKVLFYMSCYAAGSSMEFAYKNERNPALDQYSFPIVTAGIADLVTTVYPGLEMKAVHADQEFIPVFNLRFNRFFQQATSNEAVAYADVIPHIFTGLDYLLSVQEPKVPTPFIPYNFPLIRPAGRDFFTPLVPVVVIGPLMAAHRSAPLDILRYARLEHALTQRVYIMFGMAMINFPLILRRAPVPPIIASTLSGNKMIQILSLESEYSLQELLKERVFLGNPKSVPFLIVAFNNKQTSFTNVVITIDHQVIPTALATHQDQVLFIDAQTVRPVTLAEQERYTHLLHESTLQQPAKEEVQRIQTLQHVTIPLDNQRLRDNKSAMQQALDDLFKRVQGDVAAQYRLLTIIKNAPTSQAYRTQRDALIIISTLADPSHALGLVRGLVEPGDWREGRKTIRWQKRWQAEGQMAPLLSPHDLFLYEKLQYALHNWPTIMDAITQQFEHIAPPEFDQLCVFLLNSLVAGQTPKEIITHGIALIKKGRTL